MTTVLERGLGKRNTHPLLVGVQTGRASVVISVEPSRKPKIRASTEPSYATPGIYSKDSIFYYRDRICVYMFIAAPEVRQGNAIRLAVHQGMNR